MFSELLVCMHELYEATAPFHSELLLFILAVVVRQFFLGSTVSKRASKASACCDAIKRPVAFANPTDPAIVRAAAMRGDVNTVLTLVRPSAEAEGATSTPKANAPHLLSIALAACVTSKRPQEANTILLEMEAAGCADLPNYRTVMKAWLDAGNFGSASKVLRSMLSTPTKPSVAMYNELLTHITKTDGHLSGSRAASFHGSSGASQQALALVADMRKAGLLPNRITASIVLKTLGVRSAHSDIAHALQIVDSLEEKVDEVLMSSVIEACVRIGKAPLIQERLALMQAPGAPAPSTATACGTLIKAYGYVSDIEGAWRVWNDMRAKGLCLSSITIGCMVEAMVSNGDVDGGHELIMSLLRDEGSRDQINSVIFGSVLKGYSHAKRIDTMWSVFQEMTSHGIQPSAITYNLLVDACARNGQMESIPELLLSMHKRGFTPNLITYSTIIKGFCGNGDVVSAVRTLAKMRNETKFRPDEIVYNTLIDGCVQASMTSEAERLFKEMCEEGVAPTNYTITRMVKVLGQARRVDDAFELASNTSRRYRINFNAYVFSALMHAAVASRDFDRATAVLKDMEATGFTPEARIVQNLVLGMINAGRPDEAVQMLASRLSASQQSGPARQTGAQDRKRRGLFADQQQHNEDDGLFNRGFMNRVFNALSAAGTGGSACTAVLSEELRKAGRADTAQSASANASANWRS